MHNINWITVILLVMSNFIMSYAWYGHLREMSKAPLWMAIGASWLIALFEYCLAVPANRIGSKSMSLEQLKILQESISLLVFIPFSMLIMRQQLSWNYAIAIVFIIAAIYFIFKG